MKTFFRRSRNKDKDNRILIKKVINPATSLSNNFYRSHNQNKVAYIQNKVC